ncbi:GNS1/SUR4 family-domain-containing protein [Mycena metata]|uniref:Elongation of fatty acids protein n=1 Tax=Mycena metata TaxID=1033252 RepID=A0AAD7J8C2_9AGAR|nr:GNS1/SUR4 family-domain-containing protein [Mycena metata]
MLLSSTAAVVFVLATYLAGIYVGQAAMKDRVAFRPTRLLQNYNIVLSVVSLALWLSMLVEIGPLLRKFGVIPAMCSTTAWTQRLEMYYKLNYFLKYVEMLDTVLLVSWVAITVNLLVHIILYYYYAITSDGYRPWWKKHLTGLQIMQFVIVGPTSIWALVISHYSPKLEACAVPPVAIVTGAVILTSYFLLFVEFYFTAYIKKSKKE